MAYALHKHGHFVETDVAKGKCGVAVKEQWVDNFALLETSDGAVLPVDWAYVRCNSKKCSVAAHKCVVAKLEALLHKLPELVLVATSLNADLWKVKTYNALVETAFPLVLALGVLPR